MYLATKICGICLSLIKLNRVKVLGSSKSLGGMWCLLKGKMMDRDIFVGDSHNQPWKVQAFQYCFPEGSLGSIVDVSHNWRSYIMLQKYAVDIVISH